MKKILFAVTMFLVVFIRAYAEDNYFYLDTPLEGIYTTMDKIAKISSNSIKPVRKQSSNEYMYCVSPGYAINPDENYTKVTSKPWEMLNISKEKYDRIQLISYYGFMYENHNDPKWYGIAKYMIWQEVMPEGWSVYLTEILRGPKTTKFDSMINEIDNLIAKYYQNPSFSNNIMGNYKNNITLYDTNNVLHNYTSNNPNVLIENDTLIIKPSNESFDFTLNYKTDNKQSELYIYDDAQWLISKGTPPAKSIKYHVEIPKGSLKISKRISNLDNLSYNAKISLKNAKYKIFNDNYYNEVLTNEEGNILIDNLNTDSYYIKEIKSPYGLEIDNNLYQITIKPNQINVINVYDRAIISNINIIKKYLDVDTSSYLPEENAVFGILDQNENLLISKSTDTNGKVSFNLPLGNYIVSQISGLENYKKIINEEIEITDGNPIDLEYINLPIPKDEIIPDEIPDEDITTNNEELKPVIPDVIEEKPIDSNPEKIEEKEDLSLSREDNILPYISEVSIPNSFEDKIEFPNIIKNFPVLNEIKNPQTIDELPKYLIIFTFSTIIMSIFCKKLIQKRGNREKIRNI